MIQLEVMTARAENQANGQCALRVYALTAILVETRVYVSGESKCGVQQGPVNVPAGQDNRSLALFDSAQAIRSAV